MTLLWEFERDKMESFVDNLFWALDDWIGSLKKIQSESHNIKADSPTDRESWKIMFQQGFVMRPSQFSLIVQENYRRLNRGPSSTGSEEWDKICLNDVLKGIADKHRPIFEVFGSSLTIAESPEAIVWLEKPRTVSPSLFLIWWLIDAWPDSKINVDFVVDNNKVRIVFQDINGSSFDEEYQNDHKILFLWSFLVEYLIVIEAHGRCIWPKAGEVRRLEIIFPVHPPTESELKVPASEWLQ